jgi:hypothetical protein
MSIVGVEIISKAVTNEQAVTNSLEYKGELFLRRKIYLSVIIAFLLSSDAEGRYVRAGCIRNAN